MSTPRTARRVAWIAIAVALLLSASASATHLNEQSDLPTIADQIPQTGFDFVDSLIKSVVEPADEAIRETNRETADERSEPQVPTVLFRDGFDNEDAGKQRLAYGDWQVVRARESDQLSVPESQWPSRGWHRSETASADGSHGYAFGDAHGYPIHQGVNAHEWLVSPRINLDSLPINGTNQDARGSQTVQTPLGTVSATVNSFGVAPYDRVTLSVEHRLNFGCRVEDGIGGSSVPDCDADEQKSPLRGSCNPGARDDWHCHWDGGRFFIYTHEPTVQDLFHHRGADQPPLGNRPHWRNNGQGVETFNGQHAYNGHQTVWVEETFSLTRWAGQDVWIVFEAGAGARNPNGPNGPPSPPGQYFNDDAWFETTAGFYGWQIDEVTIEGPAHTRNVVADTVTNPTLSATGDADRVAAAGADQTPVGMVVLNRGQNTEDVVANLTLTPLGDGNQTECSPADPDKLASMPPGQAVEVTFPCTQDHEEVLEPGRTYRATFETWAETDTGPSETDAYPDDNELSFTVRATRDPGIHIDQPLAVTPRVDNPNVTRTVELGLENLGNGREKVDLDLTVEYTTDPGAEPWEDVTDKTVPGAASQTLTISPRTTRSVSWEGLVFAKPGHYRATVEGAVDLPEVFETLEGEEATTFADDASAGTLVSGGVAYRTNFTGSPAVDDIADDAVDEWTTVNLADRKPPCSEERRQQTLVGSPVRGSCETVWELPRRGARCTLPDENVSGDRLTGRNRGGDTCARAVRGNLILKGSAEEVPVQDQSADTEFERFEVEVTHSFSRPCDASALNYRANHRCAHSSGNWGIRLGLGDRDAYERHQARGSSFGVNRTRDADVVLQSYRAWTDDDCHGPCPRPGGFPLPRHCNGPHCHPVEGGLIQHIQGHGPNGIDSQPGNRLAFLAGQWRTETYVVPADVLMSRMQRYHSPGTVPASLASNLTLRFIAGVPGYCSQDGYGGFGPRGLPGFGSDGNYHERLTGDFHCPTWRIADATVIGHTTEGDATEMVRWSGDSDVPTVGTWSSEAWAQDSLTDDAIRFIDCTWEEEDLLRGEERPQPAGQTETCPDPPWDRIPVDDLGPSYPENKWGDEWDPSNWSQTADEVWRPADGFGGRAGAWATFDPDEDDNPLRQYEDGQLGMLVSPALTAPADGNAPTLRFDHNFEFRNRDEGRLMVRFLGSDADGSLTPETPFLPVATRFPEGATWEQLLQDDRVSHTEMQAQLAPRVHAWSGSDCDYYHIADSDCPGLQNRAPRQETLPLDAFPVLNYSGLRPPVEGLGNTHHAQDQSGNPAPQIGNPDMHALQIMDLTEDCTGPCTVQFAFRAETLHGGGHNDDPTGEGWVLDRFEILRESSLAHDIAVDDAGLSASYDWRNLSLGPGTTVTVSLDVENQGIFAEPPTLTSDLVVEATWRSAGGDVVTVDHTAPETFRLDDGESGSLEMELPVPDQPGAWRLFLDLRLEGDLLDDDSTSDLELTDGDRSDNCIVLGQGGRATPGRCDDPDLPRLTVEPNPRLAVDLDAPAVGVAGLSREVDIQVTNHGNVEAPPGSTTLTRFHRKAGSEVAETVTWPLTASPAPSESVPFHRSPSGSNETLIDARELGLGARWVRLEEDSRYLLGARIQGVQDGQLLFDHEDTMIAESRDPLYVDTVLGEPESTLEAHTPIRPDGDDTAWRETETTGPRGGAVRAWHFGDPVRRTYPDSADHSLVLPPLDISKARSASMLLTHRYDLEEGFDGGRVEVSTDDGETWRPLVPDGGYPGSVAEDGPMNPGDNPLRDVPAWTGTSSGWTQEAFDLRQLDDLVSTTLLSSFDITSFKDDPIVDDDGDAARRRPPAAQEVFGDWPQAENVTASRSWSSTTACNLEDPSGLDDCWYRENVHHGEPAPDPAAHLSDTGAPEDGTYWWMGSDPPASYETALDLDVTLDAFQRDREVFLTFWAWTGDVDLNEFDCEDHCDFVSPTPSPLKEVETHEPTGWSRYEVDLTDLQKENFGEERDVTLTFRAGRSDHPWRGTVVDDVELVYRDMDDRVVKRERFPTTDKQRWDAPPLDEGSTQGWHRAGPGADSDVRDGPDVWRFSDEKLVGRDGAPGQPAWLFGDLEQDGGESWYDYEANVHERLVTPILDLTDVGNPSLTFWERFSMAEDCNRFGNGCSPDDDRRRVLVQPFERNLKGDIPDTWDDADDYPNGEVWSRNAECHNDNPANHHDWCRRTIDLSQYEGQRVRVAFEMETGENHTYGNWFWGWGNRCEDVAEDRGGCYWALTDLSLEGDVFAGDQLHVRLRAATDRSIGEGRWTIDNLQMIGAIDDDNVAIVPNGSLTTVRAGPGTQHVLPGVVRNLGEDPHGVVLVANASLEPGSTPSSGADPVPPNVTLPGEGNVTTPLGPGREMSLTPSGDFHGGDRVPYNLNVQVPDDANRADYRIELALYVNETGSLQPLEDDRLGDHRHEFVLEIVEDEAPLDPDSEDMSVDPPSVDADEPVRLSVDLDNTGTLPAAANVSFNVTDPTTDDQVAFRTVPAGPIRPGKSATVTWNWTPNQAGVDPGFYEVQTFVGNKTYGASATAAQDWDGQDFDSEWLDCTQAGCSSAGVVLVDRDPLYFAETYDDADTLDDAGWSSPPCSPSRECWFLRHDLGQTGQTSAHIGVVGEEARKGATYLPGQGVRLVAPDLDLTGLAPLLKTDLQDSPLNPSLGFRYRSLLGDGDEVQVQRQVGGGWMNLPVPLRASDADDWRVHSIPVGAQEYDGGNAVVGERVHFGWRFDTDGQDQSIGFTLDTVSVSAYHASIAPETRDIALGTDAVKRLYFQVNNTGAAADTFEIRADRSKLNGFQVDVLTPSVTLAPGESDLVAVEVAPPDGVVTRGRSGELDLLVVPTVDPNQRSQADIDLTFQPNLLPDLAVEVERVSGGSGPVEEGETVSFLATVTNRGPSGSTPAPPVELIVWACPAADNATEADRTADLGRCEEQDLFVELANATLPELPPFVDDDAGQVTETVTWTTPSEADGTWHIVAEVDPFDRIDQYDPSNDAHALSLEVVPVARPDVRVVPDSFRILYEGEPVHDASEGDLVRIEGEIENAGTVEAQKVRLRIVNQFPLLEETARSLAPGERVELSTQWNAEPGNWVVLLEAIPGVGAGADLDPPDNNLDRWDLAVRRGQAEASLQPSSITVPPGGQGSTFVLVTNDQSAPVDLRVEVDRPDDVRVTGLPATIALPEQGVDEHRLQVRAADGAEPGNRTVHLRFRTAPDQPPVDVQTLTVEIPEPTDLTFEADPVTTAPGVTKVPINVTNPTSGSERLALDADGPEGWDLRIPSDRLQVAPSATRTAVLHVEIPHATAPGGYGIRVRDGPTPVASVPVRVTKAPSWSTTVETRHDTATGQELWIRVENTGNAEGIPPVEGDLPRDALRIEPPLRTLAPGEAETFRLAVDAPDDDTLNLTVGDTRTSLAPGAADGGPARLKDWKIRPAGSVTDTDTVRIDAVLSGPAGMQTEEVPVRAYVDGILVDERTVVLGPDDTRNVTLTWSADTGDHVISLSVGPTSNAVAESRSIHVAPSAATPGLPVAAVLTTLLVAVWIERRRRRP